MIKCLGCGAILQNIDTKKEGYTKNLNNELCERCFKIRHYNEYQFIDKDNNYYLNIIKQIEKTKDLVILVTDFLNTESICELKIKNPVLLVLSKRDLIPRQLEESKILYQIKTKLNVIDKIVIGSKNNYNLDLLFHKINKYKTSKQVYVIGYTNAGKSTLINKLIKNYSNNKHQITTSILPSTTLDLIPVNINDNLTIIDTPGLLDKGNITLTVSANKLKKILPKKEIKPRCIQVKTNQSIIIDNLFRIDTKQKTSLIFYISKELKLERFYKEKTTLKELKCYQIKLKDNSDIVIKGLGFIKVTKACDINLYIDQNIKITTRPSII